MFFFFRGRGNAHLELVSFNTSPPLCLNSYFDVSSGKSINVVFSVGHIKPVGHIFKMGSCCTRTWAS